MSEGHMMLHYKHLEGAGPSYQLWWVARWCSASALVWWVWLRPGGSWASGPAACPSASGCSPCLEENQNQMMSPVIRQSSAVIGRSDAHLCLQASPPGWVSC